MSRLGCGVSISRPRAVRTPGAFSLSTCPPRALTVKPSRCPVTSPRAPVPSPWPIGEPRPVPPCLRDRGGVAHRGLGRRRSPWAHARARLRGPKIDPHRGGVSSRLATIAVNLYAHKECTRSLNEAKTLWLNATKADRPAANPQRTSCDSPPRRRRCGLRATKADRRGNRLALEPPSRRSKPAVPVSGEGGVCATVTAFPLG
jgi:hypothetical protein